MQYEFTTIQNVSIYFIWRVYGQTFSLVSIFVQRSLYRSFTSTIVCYQCLLSTRVAGEEGIFECQVFIQYLHHLVTVTYIFKHLKGRLGHLLDTFSSEGRKTTIIKKTTYIEKNTVIKKTTIIQKTTIVEKTTIIQKTTVVKKDAIIKEDHFLKDTTFIQKDHYYQKDDYYQKVYYYPKDHYFQFYLAHLWTDFQSCIFMTVHTAGLLLKKSRKYKSPPPKKKKILIKTKKNTQNNKVGKFIMIIFKGHKTLGMREALPSRHCS